MHRRRMLQLSAMALAGAGLGGCAPLFRTPERYTGVPLPRVLASRDRVTGTLVGLRPFRPEGIRLEAERLDDKTVIHNYGHGGAGVSLAWGTAHVAADLALETGVRTAAVIGAGAVGLATARELQRRGFGVTLYTKEVWPEPGICSGIAPARFTPSYSIIDPDHRTPAFDAFYERAAAASYRMLTSQVGGGYGVSWSYRYSPRDQAPGGGGGGSSALGVGEQVVLGPGEHPFGAAYAMRRVILTVDTSTFLEALLRDFHVWGGRLVRRTFTGPRSLAALDEPVILNCTGLGAREVAGDHTLVPIRGQLTAVMPQPDVDFVVTAGGLSMVPRRNGLLLGGAPNRRGDWSLEPDEEASLRVVERAEELFGAMRETQPPLGPRAVAAAPPPAAPAAGGAEPDEAPAFSADELSLALAF